MTDTKKQPLIGTKEWFGVHCYTGMSFFRSKKDAENAAKVHNTDVVHLVEMSALIAERQAHEETKRELEELREHVADLEQEIIRLF